MLLRVLSILAVSTSLTLAKPMGNLHHEHRRQNGQKTLQAANVQIGSTIDGTQALGANVALQAPSDTSDDNFINFCEGKTLTNGLQNVAGSCNGVVMGEIPAKTNMVSSIITFPETGSQVEANTDFEITVQMANLVSGSFTNAVATYYSAPQKLQGGLVVGHTHVTVQDLGNSLNPKQPMDATKFAFFKGINDDGNGQGLLKAVVTGGLPAGNYRVCTMAASSNHAPVLMPVAQRGTPDDCTKFVVTGNGNTPNNAANDAPGGLAAAELAASAVALGPGVAAPTGAAGNGGNTGNNAGEDEEADTGDNNEGSGSDGANGGNNGGNAGGNNGGNNGGNGGNNGGNAGGNGGNNGGNAGNGGNGGNNGAPATTTAASTTGATTGATTAPTTSATPAAPDAGAGGDVGGIPAPPVVDSGNPSRPFACNGATFVNEGAAKQRSCDVQFNSCANAFNGGRARGRFNIGDCSRQQTRCLARRRRQA